MDQQGVQVLHLHALSVPCRPPDGAHPSAIDLLTLVALSVRAVIVAVAPGVDLAFMSAICIAYAIFLARRRSSANGANAAGAAAGGGGGGAGCC